MKRKPIILFQVILFLVAVACFVYYLVLCGNENELDSKWIWLVMSVILMIDAVICRKLHDVWQLLWIIANISVFLVVISFSLFIYVKGDDSNNGKEEVVLILAGGYKKNSELSSGTIQRLEKALDCASPDAMFIVSGGKVSDNHTEAECMKEYLVEHGVSVERILLEEQSQDTYENLENVYTLLKDEDSLLIVSSRFHIYRIHRLAEVNGYRKCNFVGADIDWVMIPHNYARELCAFLREIYLGRLP